jgi:hypothetical protein
MRSTARRFVPALVLGIVLGVTVVACSQGGGGSPGGGSTPEPSGTPGTPGASGVPAATESPGSGPPSAILSAEEAAAAVAATNPLFAGITGKDQGLIGQANWWEARPLEAAKPPVAWMVTYRIGWGDCQAGCIDQHTWTYRVDPDGSVTLLSESGSALSSDVLAERAAAAAWTGVAGRVAAGPTCPVERPGDSSCQPRPVAGAVLVVTGAGGTEVARVTADADGLFRVDLQPGDYTLVPQPSEGLLGTAQPVPFTVAQGSPTFLEIDYDTGIR